MLSENVGILSLEEINNIFLMFFLMIPFSALGKKKKTFISEHTQSECKTSVSLSGC